MPYAQIKSGQPIELTGNTLTSGDVQFSYDTMLLWSDAERKKYDIYPITDDAIPSGKNASGSTLEFKGGKVLRHWALVETPAPKLTTFKSDIWRRCTDAEAQMLDGALADAPATLRRLFDAVTVIEHDAPEFATLRDSIAAVVGGYTRADELLAPSAG